MRTDCAHSRFASRQYITRNTAPAPGREVVRSAISKRTASNLTAQRLLLIFSCTKSLPATRATVFLMCFLMIQNNNFSLLSPVTMGKYRIAACPTPLTSGRFGAQVSIASGRGSASTDRVMRFSDDFLTHDAAAHYALAQGIDWVHAVTRPQ